MDTIFYSIAGAIIPVSIVVVLPVMIVWLITRWKTNRDNKNAEILMKAVENNEVVDVNNILVGMSKPSKSMKEVMLKRLLLGCVFLFSGITLLLVGWLYSYLDAYISDSAMFSLIAGGISTSVGIAYLVVYRVTRTLVNDEEKSGEK